ncbi:MAG: hypothetical protein M3133_09390 [Actinomycetota bacterium]|nr:hypothetical protein [Actinomycetota bacterium]
MVRYVLAGLLGVLIALFGVFNQILWLVAVGVVLILADFAWFARFQTSAPVKAQGGTR